MATLNPLYPIAPWRLLPGMVCLDRDEFDTSGGGGGGGKDDDEDDEDDEDEPDEKTDKSKKSDDDDEDEDDDADKGLDEGARLILRKERKAARQAKARAKRAEEALEALKKNGGKPRSSDDEHEREKEAEARGSKKGLELALKSSVRAELLAAGLNVGEDKSRALKRAMRLIDFEDLSIDDDGDVDGLDDAIADLREEMPSLFAKPKKRRQNINGDDSRSGGKPRSKSASERQAELLAQKG